MTNSLQHTFLQLSELLQQSQHLWKPVAFHQSTPQWVAHAPELAKTLLGFSAQQIEQFHYEPTELTPLLINEFPFLSEIHSLISLPASETKQLNSVNPRFYAGIPGRKWQQVEALCSSVDISAQSVLEYCAGKSHLGFYIAHCYDVSVTALEWDNALVQQANSRAQTENHKLDSHQVDVLSQSCDRFFHPAQHVLALHACGGLHERLLDLCLANQVSEVSLVPCCYHKRNDEHYLPYSALGKQQALRLTKTDLHTAVMETVTAGATVVKQRKTLQTMRLGFDLLQRELLAKDNYLPLPSMPLSFSRLNFEDFCQYWAKENQLHLPASVNWSHYLTLAQQRFHKVSAFDLMRAVFRRPLEVWLNMDKALWLQEHGYEVRLTTFCDRNVSPRNILLQASR
ncbi:methyltransferase [Aliiglaciecola litoralis]|uniref:Methyltransferase n=1 Tax=Aliiglaciecola litoralis TaxID=582857 RepID=A0ABP3WW73_9ALTE